MKHRIVKERNRKSFSGSQKRPKKQNDQLRRSELGTNGYFMHKSLPAKPALPIQKREKEGMHVLGE
ncbi:MAG: hypothetical protein K9M51_00705 [Candidatus Gracilibacteria bacterium]|nr:hypothetical protein [Candidatus Gracilibacteria bacterium]